MGSSQDIHYLRQEFNDSLNKVVDQNIPTQTRLAKAIDLIRQHETLASLVQKSRADQNQMANNEYNEDLLAQATLAIIQLTPNHKDQEKGKWLSKYQNIWRENFSLFILSLLTLVGSSLIGWSIGLQKPDYAAVLIPQEALEDIIQNKAWFERLNENPFLGGFEIALNNIMVAIRTFVGGMLLGIGGLLLLGYNGLMIGALVGYCQAHGFHKALGEFVLAHGPLELTIIVAATFCGLVVGQAFFMPRRGRLSQRLAYYGRQCSTLIAGVLPWLILAGFVESFISPNQNIDHDVKFLIGILCATAFWIFTFVPFSRTRQDSTNLGS